MIGIILKRIDKPISILKRHVYQEFVLSLNWYKQNLFECHPDAGYMQTDPKQHIQQSWKLDTFNTTFYPFHFI